MSVRQNVRSAKRPFGKSSVGKMSVRQNVFRQNVFRQSVFRQNVRVPPRIEDIFAHLAGGKKFSKIDLRQAYHQI
jgi:hypothetical protein